MKVVLDTNIIISRYLSPTGLPATVLNLWEKEAFDVLVSEELLQEYERALGYTHIQKSTSMTPEEITQAVQGFRENAILVEPAEDVTVVERDRDDNKFIACALAGGAEYIVSGDNDLLSIKTYRGIRILAPSAFLVLLEQEYSKAA